MAKTKTATKKNGNGGSKRTGDYLRDPKHMEPRFRAQAISLMDKASGQSKRWSEKLGDKVAGKRLEKFATNLAKAIEVLAD